MCPCPDAGVGGVRGCRDPLISWILVPSPCARPEAVLKLEVTWPLAGCRFLGGGCGCSVKPAGYSGMGALQGLGPAQRGAPRLPGAG